MKTTLVAVCVALLVSVSTSVADDVWNYLWGKWEEKGNPTTFAVFTRTNITLSVNGTQEVWKVVGGTGLITGLTVSRGDQQIEAKSAVKFNEMCFDLGTRMWLLRLAGSTNIALPPGEIPNQPASIEKE